MKATKQQTAVEWIEDNVHSDMTFMQVLILIEQALKMEKEQIVNAHIFAHLHYGGGMIMPSEKEFEEFAQQYYNETFKK
jgi:hypothetical protein